jgi:beta-1,4-mannosyltransferase
MPPVVPWSARVQPVPSAHPYPLRIRLPGGAFRHRDDPVVPGAEGGPWWPPPALRAEWVRDHAHEVDLVHLHFGFDAERPADLEAWCDALDGHGIPLVLTLHDVVNPHFADQREHRRRLDVLVPRATTVVTLTGGAASDIHTAWGRSVEVVPHPHVAPLALIGAPRSRRPGEFVVGLHLKSLRANVRPAALVEALVDVLGDLPGAVLSVHLHREVTDPVHPRHDGPLLHRLTELDAQGRLRLTVHEPHTDDELWSYLEGLDLSVLPYAFGTHSGWLEACHDLGTPVLAPRTGHWVEQRPCLTYASPLAGVLDPAELRHIVGWAYDQRPTWAATREGRRREQSEVARRHEAIYRDALPTSARVPA